MQKERFKKQQKSFKQRIIAKNNDSYFIINLIIAGILVLMLVYSGIFSASGLTHPIKSATTEPTISTGMSRAFSEIVRGHFSQALQYNPYSITIFIFFFSQLVMRLICTILLLSSYISEKLLIIADILLSVLLFLLTFYEFISDQFEHL